MKKFKKLVLSLCVLTCIFALASCGSNKEKETVSFDYSGDDLAGYATSMIEQIDAYDDEELKKIAENAKKESTEDSKAIAKGVESYIDARKDSGKYEGFFLDDEGKAKYKVKTDSEKDTVTVTLKAKFSKRSVTMNFAFKKIDNEIKVTEITFSPKYSLGETMESAALNTVIGISTVVVVLIFLSILIAQFKHVSKIEAFFKNRKDKKQNKDAAVKDEKKAEDEEEELVDDLELVAVITAAIKASSNVASTDSFVVRSIKRAKRS